MDMEVLDRAVKMMEDEVSPDEYVALMFSGSELRVKFYENSIAVVERELGDAIRLYAVKSGRHALVSTDDLSDDGLRSTVRSLRSSIDVSPPVRHVGLPSPGGYVHNGDVDEHVMAADALSMVKDAIDAALSAGASRVAGVLELGLLEVGILTSGGVSQGDRRSYALLNVRGFSDGDASGQGVSVSTSARRLDPRGAGAQAGEYARIASKTCSVEPGTYYVILSPLVAADLLQHVGWASSAYAVSAGFSFLEGRLGSQLAADGFTLVDHGQIVDGVGSRLFDDEGVSTRSNVIIDRGTLKTYLHNTMTAAEHGVQTTGNAGIIEPGPWNLEVSPGDSNLDEMIRETKKGIILTSNWYTRFQNYRVGEYSTLPRDASPVVEGGEVRCSAKGFRISSSLPRDLASVRLISKDRQWIKWWEVETPVLAPYMLVEGVGVTRPF